MSGAGFYPTATAAATKIEQDTPCRKCGYNLRSLSSDGRCPECGTSVGFSLQGDLLRFCDPSWVDTLWLGARCIIWAVVLAIFGVLAAVGLLFGTRMETWGLVVGGLALFVGMTLSTVGWWFLTAPDPSGLGEAEYGASRKIIRVAQIVGIVQIVLAIVSETGKFEDSILMLMRGVLLLGLIVSTVGIFAECLYLKKIALRIPDRKLSDRAAFLTKALGTTYVLSQLWTLLAPLIGNAAREQPLGCFAAIVNIFVLIFFIMLLSLLEKLGKRFKEESRVARQTWAALPFGGQMIAARTA